MIIFGAGISAATIANKFANLGIKVKVYEKNKIGGNCFDYKNKYGIWIQSYGPHIFHTDKKNIYDFIKQFTRLNTFDNKVLAKIEDKLVNLPINFKSIKLLSPNQADKIINYLSSHFKGKQKVSIYDLLNCKDSYIQDFAKYIYKNVYENYTTKMWGINPQDIDKSVLERVGITIGNNDNYFPTDKWQGIPINGFTNMIEKMFKHKNIDVSYKPPKIKIKNNYVYINNRPTRELIFYCGSLDELFDYKYGHLPYRSLNIVFQDVKTTSFQNTAIVNYPNHPTMTRISEYKKLYLQNTKNISTISKEYPGQYDPTSNKFNKPFYPIQDETSKKQYHQYYDLVKDIPNFIPLGRLAQYKYYDMDDAIDNALALFNKFKDKTV